jgi:hypothetical protein
LPAKSSFRIPQGNDGDEDYDDDDDDDYKTEEDTNEDDCYDDMTYNSISASTLGYKSVTFVEGRKSISSSGKKGQKEPSTITHGPTSITLPCVLDVWDAKDASKHISIQILLLSGIIDGQHKNYCRDSTQYIDEPPMIYSENIDADAPVDMLFVC